MLRVAKYRTLGLAGLVTAVAMLAVASVGAASASAALPEFYNCQKSATGKFMAGCLAGGTEWEKLPVPVGSKIGFTSKSAVAKEKATLETVGGKKVECEVTGTTVEGKGEITGPKTVAKVVVTFHGCKGPVSSTCTTHGQSSGVIVTKEASGELVYLEGTESGAKKVGLYANKGGTVSPLAEFECLNSGNGSLIKVTGTLICPIKPVNSWTTSYTLTCNQTAGKQEFTHAEGETGTHVLSTQGTAIGFLGESFGPEESGEKTTGSITTSEIGEIKA
jgi:hypothetical protein